MKKGKAKPRKCESVTPCNGEGTVSINGHWFCESCAEEIHRDDVSENEREAHLGIWASRETDRDG